MQFAAHPQGGPVLRKLLTVLVLWLAAAPVVALSAAAQKPSELHYEMTTYYLVLLYRGPNSTGEATPEAQKIQDAHMANIRQMADAGKLLMAGPMADDSKLRGIFVLHAGSLQEAQALADSDPAVKAGRLLPEVHAWYTAKNIRVFPNADAAAAGSTLNDTGRPQAEEDVREVETRRFKAMTDQDTVALDRILSDDLTYTHSSAQVDTKAKFMASIRSGELKYVSIAPSDLQVRAYGNAAVVTGRAAIKAEVHGQPMSMELRFTDTYSFQDGRWQMVAWESTRMPNP
jgi:uncharacterized protein YciI/ketosteroid isomerase-like protein